MYGERFYGDEVLFGLSEVVYFAGAVISGTADTRVAPILVSITQAHPQGDTHIALTALLTTACVGALSGDGDLEGMGNLVFPTSAVVAGDGALSVPVMMLRLPTTATLNGDSSINAPTSILRATRQATMLGDALLSGTSTLWMYPTADLSGSASASSVAVLIGQTGATLLGDASLDATGVLRSVRTGDLLGVGALSTSDPVLRFPRTVDVVGDSALSVPTAMLWYARTGTLVGDATLEGLSVLRYVPSAPLSGDASLTSTASLRFVRTGAVAGDADLVSVPTLLIATSGALLGEARIVPPIPVVGLFGSGALSGDAILNAPGWFLWNDTMDTLLASGGTVVYYTAGDGSIVAKFVNLPNLIGSTTVALEPRGTVIVGGNLFAIINPSDTGVDRGGFAKVGSRIS